MTQVFISYKSEYRDFAQRIRDQLRAWGFGTWLDVDDIREGYYWRDEIDNGLRTSDIVVGVLTPEAVESREVKAELDYAFTNKKRLLLLKYRDCDPPYYLASLQHIDLIRDEVAGLQKLKVALETPTLAIPEERVDTLIHPYEGATQPRSKTDDNNRARMLQKVYDFWVIGVLDKALKESGAFDLGLETAPGAVLKHVDYGDYQLPTSANIADVFNDMNGELLILGAPGAGKTILLLQLAKGLIKAAQADEKHPIPAVFNLSSWATERKPLAEWLMDELRLKYQVPNPRWFGEKIAKKWIENEQMLLLLDGLDEVEARYRNQCLAVINNFRKQYRSVDLAVCSRFADYGLLTTKLDLHGAITLQPLTSKQIEGYINRDDLSGLKEVIKTDRTLQAMTATPFLLNTMVYAYQGKSAFNLQLSSKDSQDTLRPNHLFNAFVEKRLSSQSNSVYAPRQTRHYLSWLAQQMVENRQTVFDIERLKPDSLATPNLRSRYRILVKIVGLLMVLLSFGLLLGVIFGVAGVLAGGLAFGLASGLAHILGVNLGGDLGSVLVFGFAFGLVIAILLGLAIGLTEIGEDMGRPFVLRRLLYQSGAIPRNYRRFLDYAASIGILRKVGGGYIFVHRYLLEYFAELDA